MWIIYSLAAAVLAALVVVFSKAGINENLSPVLVFGIETLCMVIVTWSIILANRLQSQLSNVSTRIWVFIIIAGVLTAFSSLASFHSLKLGHASRTASFEKISLVFSVLLSVLFLKEKLNWQVVTGVLFMIAGALFIAFSDKSG